MLVTRSAALIFWVLLLTTASTITGFMVSPGGYLSALASPSLLGATGGIDGSVSIGPLLPVCRIGESAGPTPLYFNQIQVLVTPSSGLALTVPVNWVTVEGCYASGTFKIGLNPGAYSLTMTSCTQQYALSISQPLGYGCSDLPRTVIVQSGAWIHIEIAIGTGIQ
jgi:hypothetical protein